MKAYERLLKYVAYDTTASEASPSCPSTPGQKVLGATLEEELRALGLADSRMDEHGYVYATLPATDSSLPPLGLIAHMDTSPSAGGAGVRARVEENYNGGNILLNKEKRIVLSPQDYPVLREYIGQDLVVTDGTTLLGADDKAGIAEIMTALEEVQTRGLKHGALCIAFTPDEEIGRGPARFDVANFGAPFAYTVDGGQIGEIEYENFNAASADVEINGRNIHPGDAKGKMINASLLAMEFNAMLPPQETPACTEGYEGFYHLCGMQGEEEHAVLSYIVRDHDRHKFQLRKDRMFRIAAYLNEKYGEGTFVLHMDDTYYNMKEKVAPYPFLIDNAVRAMEQAGAAPRIVPIRGGTDGAQLSFMGLPCPNLSTGAHNCHGRFEFIPVQSMDTMVEMLLNLMRQPQG